jgi:predicted TPR repeat methyltransferase
LLESLNGKKYELILAIDTFEHIHPDELDPVLTAIEKSLASGGYLYCHNNWGQQDIYPMHFDHSKRFAEWAKVIGLIKQDDLIYVRGLTPQGAI